MDLTLNSEFLASVLGTTATELETSLKEGENLKEQDAINAVILEQFKGRLTDAKRAGKKEGEGRAKREVLTAKEKELREKFSVDGDTLDAIFDNAIAAKIKGHKANPEDVRKSEIYLEDMRAKIAEVEAAKSEFEQYKTGIAAKDLRRKVVAKGLSLLSGELNFALPENETIKNTLTSALFDGLFNGENQFNVTESGDIQVLDKEGNPLRDDMLKVLSFQDLLTSKAGAFFEQKKSDGRKSPANKTQTGGEGGKTYNFPNIKNMSEYMTHYRSLSNIDEKRAFKSYFDDLKSAGKIKD